MSVTPRLETILLAIDGSAESEPASEQAIDLATQVEARLLVVSVLASARQPSAAAAAHPAPSSAPRDADSRDSIVGRAQAIVQRARAAGANATYLVWEGDAGEAIVAAADSVVRNAHCAVMVVRGRPEAVRK